PPPRTGRLVLVFPRATTAPPLRPWKRVTIACWTLPASGGEKSTRNVRSSEGVARSRLAILMSTCWLGSKVVTFVQAPSVTMTTALFALLGERNTYRLPRSAVDGVANAGPSNEAPARAVAAAAASPTASRVRVRNDGRPRPRHTREGCTVGGPRSQGRTRRRGPGQRRLVRSARGEGAAPARHA